MSKLSKLINKPRLFFIDGYHKLKLNLLKIPVSLNQYVELLDKEKFNKIFIYFFTSISIITFSYFYLIGRSKYVVSSSVIVRKTSNNQNSGLSFASLIGGGNQQSLEDARFLEVYVQSPQILEEFEKEFNFKEAFQKDGIDFFSGINPDSNRETKYRSREFYRSKFSNIISKTFNGFRRYENSQYQKELYSNR